MRRFNVLWLAAGLAVSSAGPTLTAPKSSPVVKAKPLQTATVKITTDGFEPAVIKLKHGVRARITFLRKTDQTCVTQVLIPSLKVKRDLPLNKPVVVEFTPSKAGSIAYSCGMQMSDGKIIVK